MNFKGSIKHLDNNGFIKVLLKYFFLQYFINFISLTSCVFNNRLILIIFYLLTIKSQIHFFFIIRCKILLICKHPSRGVIEKDFLETLLASLVRYFGEKFWNMSIIIYKSLKSLKISSHKRFSSCRLRNENHFSVTTKISFVQTQYCWCINSDPVHCFLALIVVFQQVFDYWYLFQL